MTELDEIYGGLLPPVNFVKLQSKHPEGRDLSVPLGKRKIKSPGDNKIQFPPRREAEKGTNLKTLTRPVQKNFVRNHLIHPI
jgi:hypothetical protein